jgi:amino acid transporter/mannitol/fructose-specific phosphotransferase system IIA component (Ntr-type)
MPAEKLGRKLGFWQVFCIASGAMISSGLFVLPGIAFEDAGPAVVLSYAFAGVLVIPAMLSQAELVTAMPRSGGSYFFIERSMGALPGTLAGLANWISIALKAAFALIGIGAFARLIRPDVGTGTIKLIAVGACVVFTVLNVLSVKGVGWLQIAMVAFLLGILGVFIFVGFPAARHVHFSGFMHKGFLKVLATAGTVFVSYGGLTKVASVAEEVRRPGRNLPAGMFAAVIVVSFLYVAAVFVTVGVVDAGELRGNLTPLTVAAGQFMGKGGLVLLAAAAMLAFITTANSGILTASRTPMAMSRDGLLPKGLRTVSRRFGTPCVSIVLTSAFMIVVISLLEISTLVKAASAMMLALFVLVNVAVLVMRRSGIQNYRPLYRAPYYPYLQIAGIAIYLFLIADMGRGPLLVTAVFALAGAIWYVVYVRARIVRESAFVYMVKGIVSSDMRRSELEEELKAIALERDDIAQDRFDKLIAKCEILDLPGSPPAEELFRRAAAALAPRLAMDEQKLLQLFLQREAQSSTVIQPGLAIPHVIVDGRKLFDVLLVRCRDGAIFPKQSEPVRVVFMLVGTRDERNYHLRALMAIAHVVGEPAFVERWLAAPEAEHLRDIVLLSGRQRQS